MHKRTQVRNVIVDEQTGVFLPGRIPEDNIYFRSWPSSTPGRPLKQVWPAIAVEELV